MLNRKRINNNHHERQQTAMPSEMRYPQNLVNVANTSTTAPGSRRKQERNPNNTMYTDAGYNS